MNQEYLRRFENRFRYQLLRICTSEKLLEGTLLSTEDIDLYWNKLAPEYMADAVPQIPDYPTVSVAWAAYLGLAIAYGWDKDWEACSKTPYASYYGEQGFDDMDEHIIQKILGLPIDGHESRTLENVIRRCGEEAVSLIRHEQVEPQSPLAFYVYACACKMMFRIGAAIELKRLGYKFEKVDMAH